MPTRGVSSKLYINLKEGEQFEIDHYNRDGMFVETYAVTYQGYEETTPVLVKHVKGTTKHCRYIIHADFPAWVKQPFIVDAHMRCEVLGRGGN